MFHLSSTHSFDIEIAKALGGADPALLIHHINYWIKFNERAGKNFHEGKYWMYQTIQEMSHHFPYLSEKQIRTHLSKLVEMGILIKGNFNKMKMDHTSWYTIDFQKLFTFCPNGQIDFSKREKGSSQMGRAIPDTKTHTETNTNICADSVDAKVPKKSIKEKPLVEKVTRRELVYTSEEEHAKLLKKYGPELLNACYSHLSEWKISKRESDPKVVDKHTCYYRIIKWVAKEVKAGGEKQKLDETKEWEKTNRDLFFMLKKKYFNEMKAIEYSNGFILNKNNGKDLSLKMNPQSFKIALGHIMGAQYNG